MIYLCKFSGTCSDGIQNIDEEGIDCGGKCVELCGNPLFSSISKNLLHLYGVKLMIKDTFLLSNSKFLGTCNDGVLNQDEIQIDCGNSCNRPCGKCS